MDWYKFDVKASIYRSYPRKKPWKLNALFIKVQAEKEAKDAKEAADAERKAKEAEAKAEILSGE